MVTPTPTPTPTPTLTPTSGPGVEILDPKHPDASDCESEKLNPMKCLRFDVEKLPLFLSELEIDRLNNYLAEKFQLNYLQKKTIRLVIESFEKLEIFSENIALWSVAIQLLKYVRLHTSIFSDVAYMKIYLIACVQLTQKYYVDDSLENPTVAKKLGVHCFHLKKCERDILTILGHRLPFDFLEKKVETFSNDMIMRRGKRKMEYCR
jgi:hypothetical protein